MRGPKFEWCWRHLRHPKIPRIFGAPPPAGRSKVSLEITDIWPDGPGEVRCPKMTKMIHPLDRFDLGPKSMESKVVGKGWRTKELDVEITVKTELRLIVMCMIADDSAKMAIGIFMTKLHWRPWYSFGAATPTHVILIFQLCNTWGTRCYKSQLQLLGVFRSCRWSLATLTPSTCHKTEGAWTCLVSSFCSRRSRRKEMNRLWC